MFSNHATLAFQVALVACSRYAKKATFINRIAPIAILTVLFLICTHEFRQITGPVNFEQTTSNPESHVLEHRLGIKCHNNDLEGRKIISQDIKFHFQVMVSVVLCWMYLLFRHSFRDAPQWRHSILPWPSAHANIIFVCLVIRLIHLFTAGNSSSLFPSVF
jgi:hypothetical protein